MITHLVFISEVYFVSITIGMLLAVLVHALRVWFDDRI